MAEILLMDIPVQIDEMDLFSKLRLDSSSDDGKRVKEMVAEAVTIGKPQGLYRVATVNEVGSDFVTLDGVTLKSRVMAVNLESHHQVFPFVATCGRELEQWAKSLEDFLEQFWADAIMEMALWGAIDAIDGDLHQRYDLGAVSTMNPGSLEDWPLSAQQDLFALLGNVTEGIGVQLTESCLMLPAKSVSGIYFQTDTDFCNCKLCPRDVCSNRRAQYDSKLYNKCYL